jgi:cyclic pyranopterin phosphate synthase
MVEIGAKEDVRRIARARGAIKLSRETVELIKAGKVEKGNVLTTAQIAAVQAVKKTPELIPLCHPLLITGVKVEFNLGEEEVVAEVEVSSTGKTGVEMEAITGVAAALLTIWDMVKAAEKDEHGQYPRTEIREIRVLEKRKG